MDGKRLFGWLGGAFGDQQITANKHLKRNIFHL